jgi:hypothetical protein
VKKLLAALALALLLSLALGMSVANATHNTGEGPPNRDFARGTVESISETQTHVNAISGPLGENPQGHFYVERKQPEGAAPALDYRGDVTCLRVDGNRAAIGGEVTQSKLGNIAEGTGILITVVDNGEPGDADFATVVGLPTPPTTCPPERFPNIGQRGNFVVHDATP